MLLADVNPDEEILDTGPETPADWGQGMLDLQAELNEPDASRKPKGKTKLPQQAPQEEDEGDELEPLDELETGADEEGADEEGEEEAEFPASITALAEALDVDPTKLYGLKIPINTPDGKKEISLGEWKDSVQSQATLTAERQRVMAESRQRQAEWQTTQQKMAQQLQEAAQLAQLAEQSIIGEANDLQGLIHSDPQAYILKQQELNQRYAKAQQAKQAVQQQWQQMQAQFQDRLKAEEAQQAVRLLSLIPAWAEEPKAKVEKVQLARFLKDQGFAPEEIQGINDARVLAIAYKAWQHDTGLSKAPTKPNAEKGRKVVKQLKPGSAPSKGGALAQRLKARQQRLKQSGSVRDFAALLVESNMV